MVKKWFETIFDHKIKLRERMFRVATGICMLAAVCVLPMGRSIANILILAASLIFMAVVVTDIILLDIREPLLLRC